MQEKEKRIVSDKKYMVKLYNELNTSKYPREIVVLLLKSLFLSLAKGKVLSPSYHWVQFSFQYYKLSI